MHPTKDERSDLIRIEKCQYLEDTELDLRRIHYTYTHTHRERERKREKEREREEEIGETEEREMREGERGRER